MQELLEGVVTEQDGEFAKVRPQRHSECGDCDACSAPGLALLAFNPPHAEVGQKVRYQQGGGELLVAWVLFAQPLVAVLAGLGGGWVIARGWGIEPAGPMALSSIALFSLAVAYLLWFDRRYRRNRGRFAKIVGIIS